MATGTKLVHILAEERLLVPQEESRRSLRQIARDTESSYARVAQCDKQLNNTVKRILQRDPEFSVLKRRSVADPMGCETPVDQEIERTLVSAGANEMADRFRRADPHQRGHLLHSVLDMSDGDVERMVRQRFTELSPQGRERLLEETVDLRESRQPDRRSTRRSPERASPLAK